MEDGGFLSQYEFVKDKDLEKAGTPDCFRCYGSGGFGAVFKCVRKSDRKEFAVKVIVTNEAAAKRTYDREFQRLMALQREIEADESARQTIILPVDAFIASLSSGGLIIHLVMEASPVAQPFAFEATKDETFPNVAKMRSMRSRGSGADLIDNVICRPPMSPNQARHVVRQVLHALVFFHKHGLYHRDIKPDNLIVFGKDTDPVTGEVYPLVKLSDFGLARQVDPLADILTKDVGTRSYRAPEVTGHNYDDKVDIFSLGCTFFALVMAQQPSDNGSLGFPERFQHLAPQELLAKFPFDSQELNFLAMTTQKNPVHRLTAVDALKHPFISPPVPEGEAEVEMASSGAGASAAGAGAGGATSSSSAAGPGSGVSAMMSEE